MSDPFLILHKVRGESAFDIAERQRCGICQGIGGHNVPDFETGIVSNYEGYSCDECDSLGFWWIIPTSGHRAYPYQHWRLEDIFDVPHQGDLAWNYTMPSPWPDHYSTRAAPRVDLRSVISALTVIGPVDRRD